MNAEMFRRLCGERPALYARFYSEEETLPLGETPTLDASLMSGTPVYRSDQRTLDAIRAIVREEVHKALHPEEVSK